jgi:hypothetical protein
MLDPLRYFPLLSCLYSLHEVLHYASVQESAFMYMQGSYRSVLPKKWLWQVVSWPDHGTASDLKGGWLLCS